jgi:hydrogenase maturation protein HypF
MKSKVLECTRKRAKIKIEGIVQGVGFRPFIYRIAVKNHLNGFILNSRSGVTIEVEGEESSIDEFLLSLSKDHPKPARIKDIDIEYLPYVGYSDFSIRESDKWGMRQTLLSPDISVCPECLQEMWDPRDRRHLYPFVNCTNCGPRFTIIEDVPYDRPNTTMKEFQMCERCHAEYHDIHNRRYHAQPNACPVCGPQVALLDAKGRVVKCDDPIQEARSLIEGGRIVAIKGIGGYHLACDATQTHVVNELRRRKHREAKPLAIMAYDLDRVSEFCELDHVSRRLLLSPERPIVILPKRHPSSISHEVAPGNKTLGVMLPYTPLHYLLLSESDLPAFCMTSANLRDDPIINQEKDLFRRLAGVFDYALVHNRPIHVRCDDSVLQVIDSERSAIRRSRGYAPLPIDLKRDLCQILACGGELKNTFCLTKGRYLFLSHHMGDLKTLDSFEYYKSSIRHYQRMFDISPEAIAVDLHPDYLSTRFGVEEAASLGLKPIPIQHHHAHIVSCMIENGWFSPAIGVACDGTGLGTDGSIWGFEFLVTSLKEFTRAGHLRYLPLPGGDTAVKEIDRIAISYLYDAFGEDVLDLDIDLLRQIEKSRLRTILDMIKKGINSPLTSSCGRMFDAVSAMVGVCKYSHYEAQGAMELEALATPQVKENYRFTIEEENSLYIIDPKLMIRGIVEDLLRSVKPQTISSKFHNTVAQMIELVVQSIQRDTGIGCVALSGGCFQNRRLTEGVVRRLNQHGLTCLTQKEIPPNDGGISVGQAIIGGEVLKKCA